MLRRHWLVGIFCASLGISLGCQGNFESTGVNDPSADSTAAGSPSLRALRSGSWSHRLTGTGGQATGGSGQATGGSGQATGGSGQATGGSGQATGGSGQATGGSGQATGGSGAAAAATGGTTGVATGGSGAASAPGTGGTAATATGGSPGGSGTCGNGVLDSGETCDGSALQGATCAQLGFSGGALGCSSSCQFNASACTGGALTPTVTASRTTCTAPCGVAFDTISTSGLSGSDYVAANWDWDFNDPSSPHRTAIGFAAYHVFDNAGSYVVTTRVRDMGGASGWATKTVTVSAPSYTTYYVSSSGSDSNNGLATTSAFQTLAHAFGLLGSNVAIRFRRGDTFASGASARIITGPALISAYTDPAHVSTAAPIITSTESGGYDTIFQLSGTDPRVTDLHLTSTGGFTAVLLSTASHALVERVEVEGLGYLNGSEYAGENFYVDTKSNASFFFDNYLHDFIGYGLYGDAVSRVGITGNRVLRFTGGDHGTRIAGGNLTAVTENTYQGGTTPTPQSAITIRGNNTNIVVAHNVTNRLIEFTPQNTQQVEYVQHGLCDGNVVADDRPTTYYPTGIGVTANHIVVRNNIVTGTPTAVSVSGEPQMPANWTDKITIYNNTHYFNPASYNPDYGAAFAQWFTSTGSMHVYDNIFGITIPSTGAAVVFLGTDGTGTTSEDHNLGYDPNWASGWRPGTGTGDITGSPQWVATTGASAFKLQSTSLARNVAAASPAYADAAARPKEGVWDIGAYEYTP